MCNSSLYTDNDKVLVNVKFIDITLFNLLYHIWSLHCIVKIAIIFTYGV